jgi:hypothetical protein
MLFGIEIPPDIVLIATCVAFGALYLRSGGGT